MSRGPFLIRESTIKRALNSARAAGFEPSGFKISDRGEISVMLQPAESMNSSEHTSGLTEPARS